MKKIIFLVSGGGGNMRFFHQLMLKKYTCDIELIVVADRECGALDYAENNKIKNHKIFYNKKNPNSLYEVLEKYNPDLIITNWHKIIDAEIVSLYSGKLLNLHYSLLPSFSGLIGIEPIRLAYEQGCQYIGPTCHLVDEGVDSGKILAQAIFTTDCTQDEAVSKMFRMGCLTLLNTAQSIMKYTLVAEEECADISYAPKLKFNLNYFDEEFWSFLN